MPQQDPTKEKRKSTIYIYIHIQREINRRVKGRIIKTENFNKNKSMKMSFLMNKAIN